jgi:hypothetical protein
MPVNGRGRALRIAGGAVLLLTLAVMALAGGPDAAGSSPVEDAAGDEILGGRKYYLCMLGQALKIGGLILVRPDVVLVGAIVGGLACGFGW